MCLQASFLPPAVSLLLPHSQPHPSLAPAGAQALASNAPVFPEDMFIEMFDDTLERCFYYNVATGRSQWVRPQRFQPMVHERRLTGKSMELAQEPPPADP